LLYYLNSIISPPTRHGVDDHIITDQARVLTTISSLTRHGVDDIVTIMGKGDSYKGTILDGLSKLEIWDKDLNNDLAASRLRGYITGTKTMPQRKTFELIVAQSTPLPSSDTEEGLARSSTAGEEAMQKLSVDARYSEAIDTWDYEVAIVSKKISQSIDEAHRKSIVYLTDPKEMYDSLKDRYTRKNRARLYDLVSEIGNIRRMKNTPVQAKADSLQRINAQIKAQDPSMAYNDSQLIADLIESMDRDEYDTTIKILMMSSGANFNTKLEWEEVLRALQSRETELNREPEDESASYARKGKGPFRGRGGRGGRGGTSRGTNKPARGPGSENWTGCFTCEGDHYQEDCPEWRQTTRGKAWLKTDLGKAKLAKERAASHADDHKKNTKKSKQDKVARVTEVSDSSESEESTCLDSDECAMTIRYADVRPAKAQWHLDTCASTHITGRRDQFIGDLRPTKRKIECANGEFMMAKGIGDIKIDSIHGSQLRSTVIKGVLYAPKASENLISVGKLEKKQGIELTSSNGRQTLRKDSQVIMTGRTVGNLWQVVHPDKVLSATAQPDEHEESTKKEERTVASEKKRQESAELWHARLGHPGKHMATRLNAMVVGLDNCLFCPPFCNACTKGKMTRNPSREPMKEVTKKLECVHMDLMGPVKGSLQGRRYMLTITDQFTGYVWTFFFSNKKKAVETIKSWSLEVEKECTELSKGEKIQRIRFDRGREFLNNAMKDWAGARGTKLEPTVGYHPEANGVSERCNRTIMEKAAAMRHAVGLPEAYWELSCRAATYLRNRGVVNDKEVTPWEAWYGKKPRISHLRVWGCPAFVHIPKEKRNKLVSRAWEGVFVGYKEDTTKIWEIWDPRSQRLIDARFVLFNETKTGVTNSDIHERETQVEDETYLEHSSCDYSDDDDEREDRELY
jgi:hypothetical protein